MTVPALSVIIISRNEEACIARCLRSVHFADEIVVLDNNSTDQTRDIASGLGARVLITLDWPGFGAQKNRALAAATGDWVLSLDADEWVEPPLAAEIRAAIANPKGYDGFEIPRRSRFCGHIVRHGGWSPDLVLRLFRRQTARFSNDTVHEKVVVNGKVTRLSHSMEHDSIADLADAHDKIGRYAEASAARLLAEGRKSSIAKAVFRSAWAYMNSYVFKLGFLDGSTGAMVAAYSASYTYQKWALVALDSETKSAEKSRTEVKGKSVRFRDRPG
ncbi:MAG: glycosyltransferase family 2 protein [Mesorhizobium sp.]|nr:MAG: glycosyltransferase family 2 protein [Mesorhizobium sp.]RWM44263.1 MAG: glycosyltransferase family 2 protein [Mesorhizobium sp.]RWM49525.1 MAG: glycosyltransferase family 2 protein [Mesorhizobium sp.]RWM61558.1 MAG: glycosyltransferase family 2 protein [Mesorhizobium sp.]RWN02947.1 MAG: glycosyltransferase family 2 protein [Mesorhizobium sp.]